MLQMLILLQASGREGSKLEEEPWMDYQIEYTTAADAGMQRTLEAIDTTLRGRLGMEPEHAAVGLFDLRELRLAMIHPDRGEYAASVPKIGILLAYMHEHPEAARSMSEKTRSDLGLMVKSSSNEMAALFSRELGLKRIQGILNSYGFYDANRGGGIWVGKHYGRGDERYGDPVGDHSHAATVRQLLRFYLMLEQGKLVSAEASATMRRIFESPDVAHDNIKFVKGLAGREVQIIRKWGSWQNWLHDTAVIEGENRHYILVALTKHPRGDEYLEALAQEVDDLFASQ